MHDFTRGPVLRPLLSFAVPIIAANMLQTFYNLVDTFWVGRLGGEALAAVGLGSALYYFLLSFSWGFSAAATAIISQSYGAGRRDELGRISANLFILFVGFAITVAALMFVFRMPLLGLLGAPVAVIDDAARYLGINLIALPFAYGFTLLGTIFRGGGDSLTPMKIVLLGNVLNVVLDPILIFGFAFVPAYGVAGAAWATVISRIVAFTWGITLLQRSNQPTRLTLTSWQLDPDLMLNAVRIGSPAGAANLINSFGSSLLLRLVTPFGTATVAAHSVGVRLESVAVMPAVALGMAASNWVGQNLGASRRDRAFYGAHLSVLLTLGLLAAVGGLVYATAPRLVAVFAPGEHEVIGFGTSFLRILAFGWALFGTQIVVSHTLRGAGDTLANLALAAVNLFLFRYPAAYVFSHVLGWGAPGVWWGILTGDLLIAVTAYGYFRSGRWMERQVIEPAPVAASAEPISAGVEREGGDEVVIDGPVS